MTKPFSEAGQFEQNAIADSFFASGSASSIGETPGSFSTSLLNKEQIRLRFRVNSKTQMLPNSSSLYYFNVTTGQWNIPSNARNEHSGTFQNFAYRTVWNPASGTYGYQSTIGSKFLEDYKGFDPYGLPVVSGSLNTYRQSSGTDYNQTIEGIGRLSTINPSEVIPFMLNDYPKSAQRSSAYIAQSNETFELNIDKPFLLEKIVCEIPMEFGRTWFDDSTVSTIAYASGTYAGNQPAPAFVYYDKGGPGIVFSLLCQKIYGQEKIRDLISSEFITHEFDKTGINKARLYPLPYSEGGAVLPNVIIDAFGSKKNESVVINKNAQSQYTGSVVIKSECSVSNGSSGLLSATFFVTGSFDPIADTIPPPVGYPPWREFILTPQSFLEKVTSLFSKEVIAYSDLGGIAFLDNNKFQVTSIDAFGRGMTGFAPSGGSIFGKEYVTPQGTGKFKNPFYLSGSALSDSITQISSSLSQVSSSYSFKPTNQNTIFTTLVGNPEYFTSKDTSPYLINPGDKLILSISKTRPTVSASIHDVPNPAAADIGYQNLKSYTTMTGSSSGHDVCLNTGSINITFYGSYVRAGNSYTP
jgi:hypothetical protein